MNKLVSIFLFLIFSIPIFPQWSGDASVNNPVATSANNKSKPVSVSDGSGGVIVAWQDWVATPSRIYAQRFDANGIAQWAVNGIAVSEALSSAQNAVITSDGSGGAIIAWVEFKNGNFDIYAQRIDATGSILWSVTDVAVANNPGNQLGVMISGDGTGGVYLVWEDQGVFPTVSMAQYLDNTGALQWGSGIQLNPLTFSGWGGRVDSDASGNGYFSWVDDRSGNSDVYVQKFDNLGTELWTPGGVNVEATLGTAYDIQIKHDFSGGTYVSWADNRSGNTDIYAQRVDNTGSVLWTSNGVVISAAPNTQHEHSSVANSNGYYLAWQDSRINLFDIYAQFVNPSGSIQWTVDGLAIATGLFSQHQPSITANSNGAVVSWTDERKGSGSDILAHFIDNSGDLVWNTNNTGFGLRISEAAQNQSNSFLTAISADEFTASFLDLRSSTFHIYIQKFNEDGTFGDLGLLTTPVLTAPSNNQLSVSPNGQLMWNSVAGASDYRVEIYTNGAFAGTPVKDTITSNNFYDLFLNNFTEYWWRVTALSATDISLPSEIFMFRTIAEAPTLVGPPSNGSYGIDLSVTLNWTAPNFDEFHVQVSTDPTFTVVDTYEDLNQLTNSVNLTGLGNNVTYYWRVKATFLTPIDESDFSMTWSFTTVLETPVLFTPVDDSIGVAINPEFFWYSVPGADYYQLQISTSPGFGSLVANVNNINDTTHLFTNLNLEYLTTYYWRVRAHNNLTNFSYYTAPWEFLTTISQIPIPSYPMFGWTIYTQEPTLLWYLYNQNGVELTYEVQLGYDSLLTDLVIDTIDLPHNYLLTSLPYPDTVYWWRARSKVIGQNLWSQWCDVVSFYVDSSQNGAPYPILAYPTDNALVYSLTPNLIWYPNYVWVGGNLTYDIEITDGAFTGTPTFSNVTNQWITTNGLLPGTTYQWRVRSNNGTQTSGWSSPESFITITGSTVLPVPVLTFPIEGVNVYVNAPILTWYPSQTPDGILSYDVELIPFNDPFTGTPTYMNVYTTFKFVEAPLTPGVSYKWRVRSKNGISNSAWSAAQYFLIDNGQGGAPKPVISWPVNGYSVFHTRPFLYWYLSNATYGTVTYEFELTQASNSFTGSPNFTGISTNYFQIPVDLTLGETYKFRVRSLNGPHTSMWSDAQEFYVDDDASNLRPPTTASPNGNIILNNNSVELRWHQNENPNTGVLFDIELRPVSENFTNQPTHTDIIGNTLLVENLVSGTPYHWKVRLKTSDQNGIRYSDWSQPSLTPVPSFTIAANTTNSVVTPLISELIGNTQLSGTTARFAWYLSTPPNGNQTYRLEISPNINFASEVIVHENISTLYRTVTELQTSTTYYWRVRANKGSINSQYSNMGSFTTNSTSDISEENIIPQEFEVYQNYPNPFNPVTNIKFALPEAGFVTVNIYNILGEKLITLVNQEFNAGTYNVGWDGKNEMGVVLPSGTYIYRVTTGEKSFVKKMMLLK